MTGHSGPAASRRGEESHSGVGREPGPAALTREQRHRIGQRSADQDRTLLAMQQLEAALGAAAPRREHAWRTEVGSALARKQLPS